MSQSQLALFIEKIKSDKNLKRKIAEAEKEAAASTARLKKPIVEKNIETLKRIAREHGFDIELDVSRPENLVSPTAQEIENTSCWLTCCLAFTSAWTTEGIPTVDGPGQGTCGTGTHPY